MRPGPRQQHLRFGHLVEKQPVRLNVQIAPILPFAFERVVTIARIERCILSQQLKNLLEFGHILAAFSSPLGILAEGRRTDQLAQVSNTQSVEQFSCVLDALSIARFQLCHRRAAFGIGHGHVER